MVVSVPGVFARVAELQQLVVDLGSGRRSSSAETAARFQTSLGLTGTSLTAPTAGTGPFHPSPAPPSALTSTLSSTLSSALPSTLPAVDLASYGDDGSSSPAPSATAATLPGQLTPVSPDQLLQSAQLSATPELPATGNGQNVLAAAASAIGVAEYPSGSNDGPGLGIFRSAVAGAAPGQPWCAYFASWAARQGGTPLGDNGAGIGSVDGIAAWASANGRLQPAGSTPAPGDLVLFGGRHVGVVESVNADGTLTTVEGNYRNAVARVQRSPLEATGYVRLS